jgi:hypothetical protein
MRFRMSNLILPCHTLPPQMAGRQPRQLGFWVSDIECMKLWLSVLTGLQARGDGSQDRFPITNVGNDRGSHSMFNTPHIHHSSDTVREVMPKFYTHEGQDTPRHLNPAYTLLDHQPNRRYHTKGMRRLVFRR